MRKYGIAFMLVAFCLKINAQENNSKTLLKPNIIKINLTGLAVKNIAVQYERILGNKISIACQLRYTPKGSLYFNKALEQIKETDSADIAYSDIETGGYAITPEFRFYPRQAGKGFYLAPYFRYRNVNFDAPVSYVDDNGKTQFALSNGDFNSLIGGLMIGSQFKLGKMITLDWYILGLQYGTTKVDVKVATTETLSANDQEDIRTSIEDFTNDFRNNLTTTVGPNGGTILGTLSMFGFRGFGLNLGFRF